jgi:hypothetical protein
MSKIYEVAKNVFSALIPTSRKKKNEFMNKARERVDYYKPLIEEKCGINLGDVKIKDFKEWVPDDIYRHAPMNAAKFAWEEGRVPTEGDFYRSFIKSSLSEATDVPLSWLYFTFTSKVGDLGHFDNTIYVPFYFVNRYKDTDFEERSRRLDYAIVHELSHTLWGKICENDTRNKGERKLWSEGFATYCADKFFADLYPKGIPRYFISEEEYVNGKKKIEELISEKGEGILLKIPNRWKEFSNNEGK